MASRSWSYHDSAPDAARRNRNNAAEAGRQYVVQRQRRMMERDRVMDVALPRGRIEIYWIAQTTARILAFGVALVAAICGAYLAAKWSNKKPEGAIALAAVSRSQSLSLVFLDCCPCLLYLMVSGSQIYCTY